MRSIFEVTLRRGDNPNNDVRINVCAKDAAQAVEHALRYGKKNYYYTPKVVLLSHLLALHCDYKS